MGKKVIHMVLIAMFFIGCTKDDDSVDPEIGTELNILGEWDVVNFDYNGTTKTESLIPLSIDFDGKSKNIDAKLTFTENPNIVVPEGSYDIDLTFEILGVETADSETVSFSDIKSESEWTRQDDKITIKGDIVTASNGIGNISDEDATIEYIIEQLSETSIKLVGSKEIAHSESGISSTTTININMVLSKK